MAMVSIELLSKYASCSTIQISRESFEFTKFSFREFFYENQIEKFLFDSYIFQSLSFKF